MTTEVDWKAVAERIHAFYCEQAEREGWQNDFAMSFDELPEFMKVDNLAAARRMGEVLSLAGLELVPRGDAAWSERDRREAADIIERCIELLAEGEHDGWVQARLRQGWRPGPIKDIARREHHLLVPYADLPRQVEKKQQHELQLGRSPKKSVAAEVEDEKEKDRQSVRNYVLILQDTPFRLALSGNASSTH